MTTPEGWTRHRIAELSLSFAVNPAWPFDTFTSPDGAVVHQQLPGHAGLFFIRYGAGQRLDRFTAGLADALTTTTIVTDTPAVISGHPARQLVVDLSRRGGGTYDDDAPVPERAPIVRSRLVVLGLDVRETPVLVGYRVYTDDLATYQPDLDRLLASVTVSEPDQA